MTISATRLIVLAVGMFFLGQLSIFTLSFALAPRLRRNRPRPPGLMDGEELDDLGYRESRDSSGNRLN